MKRFLICFSIILLYGFSLNAQNSISGTITDNSTNESLPGASVVEKGTTNGTITDLDGKFTLEVSSSEAIIEISFVGYLTEEIDITGKTDINFSLSPDLLNLDEVVVVGYGTQKKSVITGSIAKVDQEIIEKQRSTRIEQALQGQTAGVVIMNNSGQPGDNLTVRIRGTGTVGNADPLYIVDGLPMDGAGLDFLSPSDVQSIEVLKDASSTAIYGTRGANGVVLITTKQGSKKSKIQVSYDGFYGIQNPWHKVDMLNTEQYVELMNEGRERDGRSPLFDDAMMDTLVWDTDWQDEMYNYNAPKQSHTLSLQGGTESTVYSSSLSYMNQEGIVAPGKSNFERVSFRLNAMHNVGRLSIGTNINLADISKQGVSTNDQFSPYSLIQAMNAPPIVPVQYEDGRWGTTQDFGYGLQEITNPVAMLSYLNKKQSVQKIIGGLYAEFEIIQGLKLKTHYSTEIAYVTDDEYVPAYNLDPNHINEVNTVSKKVTRYSRWNFDNTLRYSRTIQQHNFTALIGLTYFKKWSEDLSAGRSDLIFDDFEKAYLDNGTADFGIPEGGYTENRLASAFGRLNYNYGEKYLFEGVVRRDGSSRFGSENRFGIFPALSAGWVLSKENFFPAQEIINYTKFRFSWGRNGNDEIGDFRYTTTMTNGDIYYFGENQDQYYGIRPSRVPNPKVKWEASEQFNIGANFGFFRNRLTFTFDYYDKRTKDWLLIPPSMWEIGNEVSEENMGEVANKGFEFELGYKNNANDFSYYLTAIATTNKSEVLSIDNVNGYFEGGSSFAQGGGIVRAEVGEPLGYFYGHNILGVFQTQEEVDAYVNKEGNAIQPAAQPGDFIFEDLDTNGVINAGDKTNIGSPYPKFTMGLNMGFDWKGIDFYMFWYAAIGHDVYLATRRYDVGAINYSQEDYDTRWTGPNSTNDAPAFSLQDRNNNYSRPSTYFVRDADYLRLKNLTVGYTLPNKISRKVKIDKIRFYMAFENLLTFTTYSGLEPEVGGSPLNLGIDQGIYPQSTTVLGGVNITF